MRNQPPSHKPPLVAALVMDNDGNIGRSLGRDVKAGRIRWQIAVKVPANLNVTEFERSCEAATHISKI
jgi:hypothetical protein